MCHLDRSRVGHRETKSRADHRADQPLESVRRFSDVTSAITEPELAIVHFKTTRKSGFACIALVRLAWRVFYGVQVPCTRMEVLLNDGTSGRQHESSTRRGQLRGG